MSGSFGTFRTIAKLVLMVVCIAAVGCQDKAKLADSPKAIKASDNRELAKRWYYQWVNEPDKRGTDVSDMLFVMGYRHRDWRPPAGPDGYALRAILLSKDDAGVAAPGRFQAFVVHRPRSSASEAIYCWDIDESESQRSFTDDKWPGYLLQLDWGGGLAGRSGTFMLVIRWTSSDGKVRFTRNLEFEDKISNEVSTTTRPATGGGSAGVSNIATQPAISGR